MDLSPEELERLVLSSLATAEDVLWAQRAGLRPETFQVEGYSAAWDYIVERVSTTGYVPSAVDLATVGFEIVEGATDYQRFVNQLLHEDAARRSRAVLYRLAGNLEKDPYKTIDLLVAELNAITRQNLSHEVFFDGDAGDRFLEVARRKAHADKGERIGIPTGLPCFDHDGGDWQKGELISVMGRMGSGKSTLLLHFCVVAWAAGYRVLFISPENLADDIHLRADPMAAHQWDLQLSNRGLRTGRNVDLEQYHQYTSELSKERRWKTIDSGESGAFTVNDIRQAVAAFRPDVLAVDGVHLLHGQGETWQNIFHAGKVLKGLSQEHGLTTITACQVTSSAVRSAEENPDLGDAAYGAKAIMEDSNRVLSMAQDRGGFLRRTLKVIKWRDGPVTDEKLFLTFDVDRGKIEQQVHKYDPKTREVEAGVFDFE